MVDCYLSLGSNLGDRRINIITAINAISQENTIVKTSHFYQTRPVGFESENLFINACIQIQTKKNAFELLTLLKNIEVNIGRVEKSKNDTYTDRIIDIDILFFGNKTIETPELSIPHKKYQERDFVLRPLCDIDPNLTDPITKLTMQQYLNNLAHSELIIIVNNSQSDLY